MVSHLEELTRLASESAQRHKASMEEARRVARAIAAENGYGHVQDPPAVAGQAGAVGGVS